MKDLRDTRAVKKEPKYSDSVTFVTSEGNPPVQVWRPVGLIQPYGTHWLKSINGKSYFLGCPGFDDENETYNGGFCLGCQDKQVKKATRYFMHAFDRLAQRAGARRPLAVQVITGDMMKSIRDLIRDPVWGNPADPSNGYDLRTVKNPKSESVPHVSYSTTAQPRCALTADELQIFNNPDNHFDLKRLCDIPDWVEFLFSLLVSQKYDYQWFQNSLGQLLNLHKVDEHDYNSAQERYVKFIAKNPSFGSNTAQVQVPVAVHSPSPIPASSYSAPQPPVTSPPSPVNPMQTQTNSPQPAITPSFTPDPPPVQTTPTVPPVTAAVPQRVESIAPPPIQFNPVPVNTTESVNVPPVTQQPPAAVSHPPPPVFNAPPTTTPPATVNSQPVDATSKVPTDRPNFEAPTSGKLDFF